MFTQLYKPNKLGCLSLLSLPKWGRHQIFYLTSLKPLGSVPSFHTCWPYVQVLFFVCITTVAPGPISSPLGLCLSNSFCRVDFPKCNLDHVTSLFRILPGDCLLSGKDPNTSTDIWLSWHTIPISDILLPNLPYRLATLKYVKLLKYIALSSSLVTMEFTSKLRNHLYQFQDSTVLTPLWTLPPCSFVRYFSPVFLKEHMLFTSIIALTILHSGYLSVYLSSLIHLFILFILSTQHSTWYIVNDQFVSIIWISISVSIKAGDNLRMVIISFGCWISDSEKINNSVGEICGFMARMCEEQ